MLKRSGPKTRVFGPEANTTYLFVVEDVRPWRRPDRLTGLKIREDLRGSVPVQLKNAMVDIAPEFARAIPAESPGRRVRGLRDCFVVLRNEPSGVELKQSARPNRAGRIHRKCLDD